MTYIHMYTYNYEQSRSGRGREEQARRGRGRREQAMRGGAEGSRVGGAGSARVQ